MMHIKQVTLLAEKYPTDKRYPFNLDIFHKTKSIEFHSPVTFFIGENGTGKSTLLEALSHKCGIHIWRNGMRSRFEHNPYEQALFNFLLIEWTNGFVPGSFFAAEIFTNFAQNLDEWAATDPGQLKYFGGKSLMTQSHGQSLMSFFRSRYKIKGLYFLDEPETALSPKSQLELVNLLTEMGRDGHAQFIIATHSPILLACPEAVIYSFDHVPVQRIGYEETEYFRLYRDFMADRERFLSKS
ncbi:MAG: AAA family ATPase [Thermodesulfobacteriota bacterium]|nr:AAA family ATPase [Thermodesulfobacteriota bacterium]